jgi:hypothetical protein
MWRYVWPPVALLVILPCVLAQDAAGLLIVFLLFLVVFAFPGHLILTLLGGGAGRYSPAIAFVFGLEFVTTAYDILARAGDDVAFAFVLSALSFGGFLLFVRSRMQAKAQDDAVEFHGEAALAGAAVVAAIAPLFWFSGRFTGGEFAFFGPLGQNQLFHVTLLQRLLQHVPPDNFVVAGIAPPFYHYFNDQFLALIVRTADALHLPTLSPLDAYFRCYPGILYFLLGMQSYRVGRKMLGSVTGGILSMLLLLGAGAVTWTFGLIETVIHVGAPPQMSAALFTEWTAWDAMSSIRSLVVRPAQYNGLLICLTAIDVLLRSQRTRQDWIVAGLLLGLMAGFNYTLAATLGVAALGACLLLHVRRDRGEARDLAWLTGFIFVGALPINLIMLSVGFRHIVPGVPLIGPNLDTPVDLWGDLFGHVVPSALLPLACSLFFPIGTYGIRLFGLRAMMRGQIAGLAHRGVGTMLAVAFALSFSLGTFFTFHDIGGAPAEKILLQPTLWMLGIYALQPLLSWLERGRRSWRGVALWGMLGLTWVQSLAAFGYSQKVAFSADTASAFRDIRAAASPDDVIVYLPVSRRATPILGAPHEFLDYAVMAMTGLDGYFSDQAFSVSYALAGIAGNSASEISAAAAALYRQRTGDVDAYLKGNADSATLDRLSHDNVRWIVLGDGAARDLSPALRPWRQNPQISVYRLPAR